MATHAGRRSSDITGRVGLALTLALAMAASSADSPIVDPAAYAAFYLWSGVEPHSAVARADAVYLLWGELRRDDPRRIVALRRTAPSGPVGELWLVVRAERLDWGEDAYLQLLEAARRWSRAGNLRGIQVDFDASTGALGNYAAFLTGIRARLPAGLALSATGLMDWPAHADDADLTAMRQALDEIVIQTYRGRTTISDYPRYLATTARLQMPYRVALMEGGEWQPPPHLEADRFFQGFVVFLLAERFRPHPRSVSVPPRSRPEAGPR